MTQESILRQGDLFQWDNQQPYFLVMSQPSPGMHDRMDVWLFRVDTGGFTRWSYGITALEFIQVIQRLDTSDSL